METPISSIRDGVVDRILVKLGDQVKEGQALAYLAEGGEA